MPLVNVEKYSQPLNHHAVAERAYFKWLDAGKPPGQDNRFWLEAEMELLVGFVTQHSDPLTLSDYKGV